MSLSKIQPNSQPTHQPAPLPTFTPPLTIRRFYDADYQTTYAEMQAQTLARIAHKKASLAQNSIKSPKLEDTSLSPSDSTLEKRADDLIIDNLYTDELWLVEHRPVYTLGQAGKREHILCATDTPIIQTDRGGQVTWHGTGQLVLYWLFDLQRLGWGVRDLVSHAEQCLEDVINAQLPSDLIAKARQDAPGVYIYRQANAVPELVGKVASLGFKIKQGFCYHGIALNIRADMRVFDAINPCGYQGMTMLNVADVAGSQAELSADMPLFDLAIVQNLIQNLALRRSGLIALRTH